MLLKQKPYFVDNNKTLFSCLSYIVDFPSHITDQTPLIIILNLFDHSNKLNCTYI